MSILRCRCNVGNCGRLVATRDDGPSYVSYDWQQKAASRQSDAFQCVRSCRSTSQILFVRPFPSRSPMSHNTTRVISRAFNMLKHSDVYIYDSRYMKQHSCMYVHTYATERHTTQRDLNMPSYTIAPRRILAFASKTIARAKSQL